MTSFAGRLLLESVLAPAVIAGLIVLPTRWLRRRVFLVLIFAAAFLLAIGASYVLVFGWPHPTIAGARPKLLLLTAVSLLPGLGLALGFVRSRILAAALLAAGLLWIGWPALTQDRSTALLLALAPPLAAGLWVLARSAEPSEGTTDLTLSLAVMALGLAFIALFARTLSLTQLSLTLASTLPAMLVAGRRPPPPLLPIAGVAMLIGLAGALLLYSEANPFAIALLFGALPAASGGGALLSLTAIAVAIAWIDAV